MHKHGQRMRADLCELLPSFQREGCYCAVVQVSGQLLRMARLQLQQLPLLALDKAGILDIYLCCFLLCQRQALRASVPVLLQQSACEGQTCQVMQL